MTNLEKVPTNNNSVKTPLQEAQMLTESELAIVSGGIDAGDVIEYTCGALGAVLFYIPCRWLKPKLLNRASSYDRARNTCINKIELEQTETATDEFDEFTIKCYNNSKRLYTIGKIVDTGAAYALNIAVPVSGFECGRMLGRYLYTKFIANSK